MERMLTHICCLLLLARFTDGVPELKLSGQERIVGGTPTTIEDHPWQVSIQRNYRGTYYHRCGGSILAAHWVLTAAHCIDDDTTQIDIVVAGTGNHFEYDSNSDVFQIIEVVPHRKYDPDTYNKDIALLRLDKDITFDNTRSPVLLPSTDLQDGYDVNVTGWGTLSADGPSPQTLQMVEVSIVSRADCRSAYRRIAGVTNFMLCAGASGKDSCQGDSGGPLTKDGVLYGVVSWGIGCANPSFPGVYTKVSKAKKWIERKMAKPCPARICSESQ